MASLSKPQVLGALERHLEEVARIRRLPLQGAVRGEILEPDALVERVRGLMQEDVPPEALVGLTEALFALGTVPPNFDYEASVLAMMGDELAGLYDPDADAMYLRADLGEAALEATLQHELVHALQDQHYDIGTLIEWQPDGTDRSSALSALAEGDATSAMLDGMLAESGKRATDLPEDLVEGQMALLAGATDDAERVPAILKRSLVSPYLDGLRFVHAVRRQHDSTEDWEAIDRIWKELPTTTEQILHLDKYEAREPAVTVPVPSSPDTENDEWRASFHDVWGEQSLRLLFEEWMPAVTAREGATGWGGDRLVVHSAGGQRAVAWHVVADDSAAATRMYEAFVRGVLSPGWSKDRPVLAEVTREQAARAARKDRVCREHAGRGPFVVARKGKSVVVVVGPYERSGTGGVVPRGDCDRAVRWAGRVLAGR